MENKSQIWEQGAKGAIALGLIPVIYLGITTLLAKVQGHTFTITVVSTIVWMAKFAGCILVMKMYMKKFAAQNSQVTNSDTFKLGCVMAICSALIFSAAQMAYLLFIAPDTVQTLIDTLKASPMMDANSVSMLDDMAPKIVPISFFVNLIYCMLFGMILSAILSRSIPADTPFSNDSTSQTDEQ